jgi:hypothetical protein
VKVRRTRDENEAMGRKDGRGVLMVGRREIASERGERRNRDENAT